MTAAAKAERLVALHRSDRLVLAPNAWDPASARVLASAGFDTIASSSAAVAWANGHPDGQHMTRAEMVSAAGRIARAVDIPVSADLEAGYQHEPGGIEATI